MKLCGSPWLCRIALVLLMLCAAANLGAGARAQIAMPGGGTGPFISHKPQTQKPGPVPEPGLPGAKSNPAMVAPADKAAGLLEPTDALFDAINRGDIAAARDAIGRGADLNSHNLLGLTPLDLSVDLARNDISFLLLSLRGANTAQAPVQPSALAQSPRPPARPPRRIEAARVQTAAPPPRQARLFAGNGGAPQPDHGFLGFDPGPSASTP